MTKRTPNEIMDKAFTQLDAARAMLAALKRIASLAVAYENDPKEMCFQISLATTRAIAEAEAAGIPSSLRSDAASKAEG